MCDFYLTLLITTFSEDGLSMPSNEHKIIRVISKTWLYVVYKKITLNIQTNRLTAKKWRKINRANANPKKS